MLTHPKCPAQLPARRNLRLSRFQPMLGQSFQRGIRGMPDSSWAWVRSLLGFGTLCCPDSEQKPPKHPRNRTVRETQRANQTLDRVIWVINPPHSFLLQKAVNVNKINAFFLFHNSNCIIALALFLINEVTKSWLLNPVKGFLTIQAGCKQSTKTLMLAGSQIC